MGSLVNMTESNDSPLIGLLGKKGSGKDTFAGFLGFQRLAFADPLKNLAYDFNPVMDFDEIDGGKIYLREYVDFLGWDGAKQLPTVRQLLQRLGEAMRQHAGDDVWVRALATAHRRLSGPVVVTDVRRRNEAEWIKAQGGLLVRIERPGLAGTDTDVSETELDAYVTPLVIINDGDVRQLARYAADVRGLFDQAGICG